MPKTSFVDLCKKVRSAWPKENHKSIARSLLLQVSLLRSYPAIARMIRAPQTHRDVKHKAESVNQKEMQGEVANVHRCSLDSKHHHLMIHGEALARRHMAKKKLFACNPREQEVANLHLKRLEILQVCLKQRSIFQVSLEEQAIQYFPPSYEPDRHFHLTRIINFRR